MRLGRKNKQPKNDEASTNQSINDEASISTKESASVNSTTSKRSRRKLGSRVKGLFKGKSKRKNRGGDKDQSDATSLQGLGDENDNAPAMSHPAAGLTHEMLGIPEEDDDDDNGKTKGGDNLDSKDPMDQTSPMEGGVNDKYLGGNYDDLIEKDANSLIVVLLLIDPVTLRFELLQLEFDDRVAKVVDALEQIPESATEVAIKSQAYKWVLDGNLQMQKGNTLLKTFAKNKDIFVAMAASQDLEEASRLARPILSDDKVVTMLRGKGFDVSAWAKDENDKARSFRANITMVGKLWNKYGRKHWTKYGRYVKLMATVIGLAMVMYILANTKIHGLDELIYYGKVSLQWADQVLQRARESMRSDWRLASGTKWNGRDMEMSWVKLESKVVER